MRDDGQLVALTAEHGHGHQEERRGRTPSRASRAREAAAASIVETARLAGWEAPGLVAVELWNLNKVSSGLRVDTS